MDVIFPMLLENHAKTLMYLLNSLLNYWIGLELPYLTTIIAKYGN
jgi:hypothetical protein